VADKESAPNYEIQRTMQLKQKRSARWDGFKISRATRSPEIDLVRLAAGKKLKPLIVGNADIEFHGFNLLSGPYLSDMLNLRNCQRRE
jgi:hypothetical protein